MNCSECNAELLPGFDYCPRCGARQSGSADAGASSNLPGGGVSTGGGAYITGGTQARGGTFIGRDQHVEGDYQQISQQGLQAIPST